jgi:hypothetical protein
MKTKQQRIEAMRANSIRQKLRKLGWDDKEDPNTEFPSFNVITGEPKSWTDTGTGRSYEEIQKILFGKVKG